jgi:hypothetical protein
VGISCAVGGRRGVFLVLRANGGLVAFTGAFALRTKPDLRLVGSGAVENRRGARERLQSLQQHTRTKCVEGLVASYRI